MRPRPLLIKPSVTIFLSCLSIIATATPRVFDALLLPLRIPPQQCFNFNASAIAPPPNLEPPTTQCTWADIFECAAKAINCGQICLETTQRVPSDISIRVPPPQCSACLSSATISRCALCYGTHIPTGQASAPSAISRTQLCVAAQKIPQAKCIADGLCSDKALQATTMT
ncbi:MAG: hypothetical protein Q9203_004806, partial [Teloschistes exilis]